MSSTKNNAGLEGAGQEIKRELTVKVCDLREDYDVKDEVGRGKFGVVHKVISKNDGRTYAAKFVKVTQAKRKDVFREIDIMKQLNHESLVNLTDVFDMQNRIVLVMEFISGGELFERVVEEDNLTESEAAIYMRQILEGLQHMHKKNIVHLDLKPENVVCVQPKSTRIKLIDFGLARQLENGKETKITCGTPEFVAPEVLNYDPVTLASDMWSVGVIAYILLSGLSPFLGDTDTETFANVTASDWDFDDEAFEDVSNESKDFIEGLIVLKPRDRRTVDLCLEHDWIQNHSCKKKKKLNIENLRKFLAKKRWQKSVNAVRAIRRLSSFGASLLGKSGSSLPDRKKLGSTNSPNSSIAEDGSETRVDENTPGGLAENVNGNVEVGDDVFEENGEIQINRKGITKEGERKSSYNDISRSLANISQLRQKFETLSDSSRNSSKNGHKERKPRSSSLDFDYIREDIANEEDAKEQSTFSKGNTKHEKGDFFKSKTIERSSKLAQKNASVFGKLSKSTESLLTSSENSRSSREFTMEKTNKDDRIRRSGASKGVSVASASSSSSSSGRNGQTFGNVPIDGHGASRAVSSKGESTVSERQTGDGSSTTSGANMDGTGATTKRAIASIDASPTPNNRFSASMDGSRTPSSRINSKNDESDPSNRRSSTSTNGSWTPSSLISSKIDESGAATRRTSTSTNGSGTPSSRTSAKVDEPDASNRRSSTSTNGSGTPNSRINSKIDESGASTRRTSTSTNGSWTPNSRINSKIDESGASTRRTSTSTNGSGTPSSRTSANVDGPDASNRRTSTSMDRTNNPTIELSDEKSTPKENVQEHKSILNDGKLLADRNLERGEKESAPLTGSSHDAIKKNSERGSLNNVSRSDKGNSVRDESSNIENGKFSNKKVTAARCEATAFKRSLDKKLNTARSGGDTAATQVVISPAGDGDVKQTGQRIDVEMPHKKGWSKSNAAAKRASFREILNKSLAADDVEDDDGDSGEEEAIKIETRKDRFEDSFEVLEEIGRGRFGIVSKVKEKATGKFYAAKFIKVRAATRCIVRQEIELLCAVRHKRIVKLHDVFEESRRFILVLEWVAGGELFEKLSKEEIISEKEAVFFIKQILQGVRCMHKKGILHLDLKPENVMLVDPDSTDIKIIDFGLAKRYNPKEEIKVLSGTPAFAAPEVINFEMITAATDMWSVGVIAYVLMSGVSPFVGEDNQETCSNVTKAIWDFDHVSFESVSPEAKDFISKLMVRNPRQRMSIDACLEHAWIKTAKKRKNSIIQTRDLYRHTKSFSKSADLSDEVFADSSQAMPSNGTKSGHGNESDVFVNDDLDTKTKNQPIFQVVNTMDESSSDAAPISGTSENARSQEEYQVLEERYRNMEKDYGSIKARLRKQVELQNEMEALHNDLEKSLQAHKKLQESLLFHEEEKGKLTEAHDAMKNNVNRLETKNQELLQKLEILNENYDKLGRKYKRLQEKLERNEDLEDRVEELERTKARKSDKIRELEALLSDVKESKRTSTKTDDSMKIKLEKENRSLQSTVEGCHQEIEELEERLISVEGENSKLRTELIHLRNKNNQVADDNRIDRVIEEKLERMEALRIDLEEQIAIEVRDRKLAERERDTIEEEFAEERSSLENRIEKVMDHNKQLEEEIREMTSLLDASKKSYFQLDEEFQELKKEKGAEKRIHLLEIKSKQEEIEELEKEKDTLASECKRLDRKMIESIEEIKKLEVEKSKENHVIVDRRSSGNSRELERVKDDLKMTQDHLRIATDTNSLLQLEIKKLKKDFETELNIQLIELEAKLSKAHEAEIEKVREELITLPNNERKELEDRITVQDFAIRKLQAILEVRESEERHNNNSDEIVPLRMNGTRNSPPIESVRTKTLPESINVTISPGNTVRVEQQDAQNEDEEDRDDKDSLTERELRRIAYKIADGVWNTMGQALCLRGPKFEEIMASSYNDQEKVFQLLNLWKSEMKQQPRMVMISQLTVAGERMKRRDIVKFMKELNGREGSSMSIRKRIRNFVR